jgi:FKBP-type peptidyl-prolyl cis-trans isomerase FkpA
VRGDIMRNLLLVFFGTTLLTLMSCGEDRITPTPDPKIQRALDIELINEYLIDNGYASSINDTTSSGVRYVILDDGGKSENGGECGLNCIDESDIVTYRYTGMLLDGTIFDTTVKTVGDSLALYYEVNLVDGDTVTTFEDREFTALIDTYSTSGWTVEGFITGFIDGFAVTLNKMNIGGSSRILIPSDLAYGTVKKGLLIPASSVLVFDLYPEKVEKQ